MSISSSKEFLINMKPGDIPPWHKGKHFYEQPYSTIEFFHNEMDKIRNGLTIDGVFIHPWLYFHLNVFKTPIPQPDKSEPNIHPPLRDNEWYMAENYKLAQDSNKGIIMFGSRRFSKALKDDELLFYVDGSQRPIGNAKVGDYIFGGDGKPTKITGVYPQGKVQLYKVTLDDGREIKCCADHLWEVFDLQAGIMKTLPLKEIIKRYKYERKAHGKSTHVYNYYIPISEAIEYPYTELPVDPYILGVWLGDGHSKTSAITNIDDEIKSLFSAYAETLGLHIREEGITMFATSGPSTRINPFKSKLLALNVINNKHIPEVYFRASKEQRLELLRGIMDSDGTISRGGHAISFSQKKERLASDVLRLCHELGIRAHKEFETGGYTLKDGNMNTFFRVNLFPRINPFKLKRKANRFRETVVRHEKTRRDRVPIINIEVAEVDNATCIRVDNKDSLFLTTNCVVTHNSVQESSILMWNSLTRENITNDVTCGTSGDLSNITKFLQIAHADMHPAFRLPTIRSQWDKLVQFGFKEAGTELNRFYSEIRLVNAEDGLDKKSEKGAGGAPGCVILDEIGKFNFLPYYLGLLPALKTPYGLKAVVLLSGTGGNADLSKDAEKVLNNPEAYSLLPMNWDILENKITDPAQITWKRKLFGMYIPPQMAYEEGLIKNEKTIAEYLGVSPSKSLNEIKIQVTDWENSNKVLLNLRKQYENDKFALDKERMYHPMNIDECFLKGESNPFPANIAKEHRVKLEASGDIGKPVELRRTENNWFSYTINNELKRAKYPHDPGPINSPFILYDELPTSKPSYGEFVSGLDPYKSEESTTNSVASFYVLQRRSPMIPIELIKMSYAARPNKFGTLHRNLHMGIEAWNAECLMENADPGFFQYTEAKHITRQLLAEGVDWAKMVNPKANPRTSIGFAPSPKNIEYLVSLTIDYCWEQIEIGKNEDGTPIIKYGVEFIPDIELLREIEDYGKGTNFDRIRSFGAALAWARWLDKLRVVPKPKVIETKSRDELRDKLRKANKGFLPSRIKK